MDKFENFINQILEEANNLSIPEFEDYSPNEMQYILNNPFEENSPVGLLRLSESDYDDIPILNQIKYLLRIIENNGELKLTANGFLPVKVVSDIYNRGFIKDDLIESGISKLYKETDSITINLTRILAELSGVVKKRKGKLSLTKKGKIHLNDNHELLKDIFTTIAMQLNWAYFDLYESEDIGQIGLGFTLILLNKYGGKKRLDSFYSGKYFKAFPELLEDIKPTEYETVIDYAQMCYSLRTFDRFLDYLGLIKIEKKKGLKAGKYVIKTELFDKLIKIKPPAKLK